eukprot:PhF_6_TR6046/c2_g2_i1/m.8747
MKGYNNWPVGFTKGTYAFAGGVYAANSIWAMPHSADRIMRLQTHTRTISKSLIHTVYIQDGTGFSGVATSIRILNDRIQMLGYNTWPGGFSNVNWAFIGGVYDGSTYIWMVPYDADRVIRVDTSNGAMTGYNSWPAGFTKGSSAFWGGVYDGTSIWLVPCNADRVVRV